MALGRKTGGRNFQKGNSGRPKGAKDKLPRGFRSLCQRVVDEHEGVIEHALLAGIGDKRQAHRYLAILASLERQQHDHEMPELAQLTELLARKVVHELHPGPTKVGGTT